MRRDRKWAIDKMTERIGAACEVFNEILAERERCARIVQEAFEAYEKNMEPIYKNERWEWALSEMNDYVADTWNAENVKLRELPAKIRSGE